MAEEKKPNPNAGFASFQKRQIIPYQVPRPVKAISTYNIGRGRTPTLRWEYPEWDLVETGRIIDVDSYVRRAFRVKKNLFLKEGYEFTGPNVERIRYIKRRLQQVEFATGTPFHVLMSQTIDSLIRTSNAFWVKVRREDASGGQIRTTVDGKRLLPVAGYFLLPAETIVFKRDEYGKILKYQQEVYGKSPKEFKPEDVIHFCLDKREGFAVGTPILVPVRDDIRALRRIEENVELLVYNHLFPLFHYQVGTKEEEAGMFADGTSEIDIVKTRIAEMPSDGFWVTPERHTITPIQSTGQILPIKEVIDHFKQRIFTGLGVSSVDMGEGGTANRSTAQTLSRNLIDDTKADQKEFGAQFYSYVIQELLQESTFSTVDLLDEENRVFLKFKEIDFEARQAKENHAVDIFTKDAITHDEMREMLSREPFVGEGWPTGTRKSQMFTKGDGDWAKTNYGLIRRDTVILQSLDEPGTDASKAETKSRSAANSSKAVSNKNQPTNQHGTRSSTKVNRDFKDYLASNKPDSLKLLYSSELPTEKLYKSIKQDVIFQIRERGITKNTAQNMLQIAFAEAQKQLINNSQQAFRIGLYDEGIYPWEVPLASADAKISDHVSKYIQKLNKELNDHFERNLTWNVNLRNEDAVFAELILDTLEYRTRMIDDSEIMRAYNFGLTRAYRVKGFKKLTSVTKNNGSCNICSESILSYLETDAIIYEELPPRHPGCNCLMKIAQ